MQAKVGGMQPFALQPPEPPQQPDKERKESPLRPWEKSGAPWFQTSNHHNCWENTVLLSEAAQFVIFCYTRKHLNFPPGQGHEPWTLRLKVWRSTDWATQALFCYRKVTYWASQVAPVVKNPPAHGRKWYINRRLVGKPIRRLVGKCQPTAPGKERSLCVNIKSMILKTEVSRTKGGNLF